jgi:hypothetical protein
MLLLPLLLPPFVPAACSVLMAAPILAFVLFQPLVSSAANSAILQVMLPLVSSLPAER